MAVAQVHVPNIQGVWKIFCLWCICMYVFLHPFIYHFFETTTTLFVVFPSPLHILLLSSSILSRIYVNFANNYLALNNAYWMHLLLAFSELDQGVV